MRLSTQGMHGMPAACYAYSSTDTLPCPAGPTARGAHDQHPFLVILMRWPCEEAPPVPIPNTAVKLLSADGTATSGRVGRCLIFFVKAPWLYLGAFFFGAVAGKPHPDTRQLCPPLPPARPGTHPLASRKARSASQPEDHPLHPSEIPSRRPGQAPICPQTRRQRSSHLPTDPTEWVR